MHTARIEDAPPGTQLILDPNTLKVRNARDIQVTYYNLPDPKDPESESHVTKCVKYTVVGRRHSWPNFALYDVFVRNNPNVEIAEADEPGSTEEN